MGQLSVTEFGTAQELPHDCGAAMRNLILACADTKLLLGYHYGEWTFGTPALEAAIANCSLAQTELGHVRLLHAVLRSNYEDDPDALVERRDAAAFANVTYLDHQIADWPGYVAANCVVDLAVTRVLHALRGSAFRPLRMSVDKMIDEERYHIHHGQGWLRTLATKQAESREAITGTVNAALASVAEWFGPPNEAEDAALVAAGCKARSNTALYQALIGDVSEIANAVGVELKGHEPDFAGWSPTRRRIGHGGPDDEILEHLRGSRNEVFKL